MNEVRYDLSDVPTFGLNVPVSHLVTEQGAISLAEMTLGHNGISIEDASWSMDTSSSGVLVARVSDVRSRAMESVLLDCADGVVGVSATLERGVFTLRVDVLVSELTVAPSPLRSPAELSCVPHSEAVRFVEAVCASWLQTEESAHFRRRDAFGRVTGDVLVLPELHTASFEAVSPWGVVGAEYLEALPTDAVMVRVPVLNEGCEAFQRFAASYVFNGMSVARLENPSRDALTKENIFIFVVSAS